ncbi:hypothetical protein F1942_12720 [Akkermansia sp. BIOML-A17]|uniref:hypothetical protein n=1 Tax=unclassified Akkermansia TaxID=2608915 RepID=UPI00122FADCA|nr:MULTISPECIES: hypothetical protein [unclassified Akkermansia]KAA3290319.1 hypothetical protein F1942_12720 [Akkermansia sp. BIOML-A17]
MKLPVAVGRLQGNIRWQPIIGKNLNDFFPFARGDYHGMRSPYIGSIEVGLSRFEIFKQKFIRLKWISLRRPDGMVKKPENIRFRVFLHLFPQSRLQT